MKVVALSWLGVRTADSEALAGFCEAVLGLALVHREDGFWVFETEAGSRVEVFAPSYPGKDHFVTGPVAGFAVADLDSAAAELAEAGVELLGEPGPSWQHFRAPDGNVYELTGPRSASQPPTTERSEGGALARGLVARATGDLADALVELRQAAADSPLDPEAWYWLAVTQDNLGMEATAVPCYQRALQLGCVDKPAAHAYLASSLQKTWRPEAALAHIELALAERPEDALFVFISGNVLADLGRYGEAEAAYRRAVVLDPGLALAWHHLGQLLGRLDRLEEAVAAYEAAGRHGLYTTQS
ncbi:MAG: VOC family protein [Ferrimicrobium sp.]|jgi:Flp pilus assembly protein TadD|uniref:tetratricopeptide repeat protein n=2 Tax=Ferrimicrobium TaxID=121038 RepID=UPI00262D661A|nr:tetratricopeptide repeat protein [Ferrimicrobium sp.]